MPKKKLKIGVIFGGRSGEHEVSIVSAQSVIKALDKNKYEVIPIGITKAGQWLAGPQAVNFLKAGMKKISFKSILAPDPTEKGIISLKEEAKRRMISQSLAKRIDVIFPVLHGTFGEDGTIQGLLELANIAYVGAGVLGSAVGMDKVIQKEIFKAGQLPIVKYDWFIATCWYHQRSNILRRLEKKLQYPMFVKPANLGSSVGISKVRNRKDLIKAVKLATQYDRKIIVEQGVNQAREIEVSVLGNDKPQASIPGEIIPSNEFYDYEAKYIDSKSKLEIPARLSKKVIKKVQNIALAAFRCLDLSGMARVDFFVTKNTNRVYLSEVNTIPGFTSISMYPKLWQASGLPYIKLLDKLIDLARQRHREKNKLKTSFDSGSDWYQGN